MSQCYQYGSLNYDTSHMVLKGNLYMNLEVTHIKFKAIFPNEITL